MKKKMGYDWIYTNVSMEINIFLLEIIFDGRYGRWIGRSILNFNGVNSIEYKMYTETLRSFGFEKF